MLVNKLLKVRGVFYLWDSMTVINEDGLTSNPLRLWTSRKGQFEKN